MEINPSPLAMDVGMLSMEGDHARKPLLQGKYDELSPRISPDGRWMAYTSDESGQAQIYVRPFPEVDSGGRWQVSTNGGNSPFGRMMAGSCFIGGTIWSWPYQLKQSPSSAWKSQNALWRT